jgi:uncharacterized membrane protein
MIQISFVQPEFLLILLLLIPLWLVSLRSRRPHRISELASLLLSSLIICALASALAGAQLYLPVQAQTTIFLLDQSDSISDSARLEARNYIQQAFRNLPKGDQAGLIVFAEEPTIAILPSETPLLETLPTLANSQQSDLGKALQLGVALLPEGGGGRLVLLSDGNQTRGDLVEQARRAAGRAIRLDVVPLESQLGGFDLRISELSMPQQLRQGQQARLQIETYSTQSALGRLVVSSNGTIVSQSDERFEQGYSNKELVLPEPGLGFQHYSVRIYVANDRRPENNQADIFSNIAGPAQVLLVSPSPQEALPLQQSLEAAQFQVVQIRPAALPRELATLSNYDATILLNVGYSTLPEGSDLLLQRYVRDLGRGFAMIGGPNSFGAGGYRQTPIEELLPVRLNPQPNLQAPPAAIVVVVDVSGSMARYEGDFSKLQLASQGIMRLAEQLRDEDLLTIIPFDRTAMGVIGPLAGSERASIPYRLEVLKPGTGGIHISDGLRFAHNYLKRSDHRVRHLIVLTDGDDTAQKDPAPELVRQLQSEGITVSLLAIGNGRDVAFVEQLAQLGGGRFFLAESAASLPAIMSQEARLVLRPYIIEGQFVAKVLDPEHSTVASLDLSQQLSGYVATQAKQSATVLVQGANDDPLLAVWQYGLGRSLIWSSDLGGPWSRELVQSPSFGQLSANMVSWILPANHDQVLDLQSQVHNGRLELELSANDQGRPISNLAIRGHLFGADGSQQELELREFAPGRYTSEIEGLNAASYAIELQAFEPNGTRLANLRSGIQVNDQQEYLLQEPNRTLLQELATLGNGRVAPSPQELYSQTLSARSRNLRLDQELLKFALWLLPLMIFLRRLRYGSQKLPQSVTSRADLSWPDQLWMLFFGVAPFHNFFQQRRVRRRQHQDWGNWIHQQAQEERQKKPTD